MTPPTPRLRPIPLPQVRGGPPSYPAPLPSPPASSAIALNPILRSSSSSSPQLYYDVSRPPFTAIFDPYDPYTLTKPATTPPLPCFRILPPTTPEWPVMVYNQRGVTVFDVLKALYHSLRTPVSPSVWDGLCLPLIETEPPVPVRARSHDHPRTIAPATGGARRLETNRRIDHLHGRTMFAGLEKGPGGPEEWLLRTAPE